MSGDTQFITLREAGQPDRLLDRSSGRVMDMSGKTIGNLSLDEENTRELADFASWYAHAHMAQSTGRPTLMRDRDGGGMLVTMDLSPADVHIDRALPNYAGGYRLEAGVADVVSPPVVVDQESNKYFTWDRENAFQQAIPVGSSGGAAVPEINPTLSNDSYSCTAFALGAFVSSEVQGNADSPLRPLQAAIRRVMDALLLARERRAALLLTTGANWDSNNTVTLTAGNEWDSAGGDPIKDLQARVRASWLPVTAIVMPEPVEHAFIRNPNVQKYGAYKPGTQSANVMAAASYAAMLQLPPIYTAKMKFMGAALAQTYVWGEDVVLVHQPPENPPTSQEDVATSYTFRWKGMKAPDGSPAGANGFEVRSYYDNKRGPRGGNVIVVVHNDAEKMTSKYVGGLIKNCLA